MESYKLIRLLTDYSLDCDSVEMHRELRRSAEMHNVDDLLKELKIYMQEVTHHVENCPGVVLSAEKKPSRPDNYYKNLCWLSSASVLTVDDINFYTDPLDPTTPSEIRSKATKISKALESFEALASNNIVIPVPQKITVDATETLFEFVAPENAMHLNPNMDKILYNLEETSALQTTGVIKFLLPQVSSAPLDDLISIRAEYKDEFTRFQKRLLEMVRKSSEASSERKLIDVLMQVDYEVHRLQAEFDNIKLKRRWDKSEFCFSFGILSLMFVVPPELFKAIAAFFGVSGVMKSARNIRLNHIEEKSLNSDPFIIPYKLSELARQCKK